MIRKHDSKRTGKSGAERRAQIAVRVGAAAVVVGVVVALPRLYTNAAVQPPAPPGTPARPDEPPPRTVAPVLTEDRDFFLRLETGGHTAQVRGIAVTGDTTKDAGARVASVSDDKTLRFWQLTRPAGEVRGGVSPEMTTRFRAGFGTEGAIRAVAVNPVDQNLYAVSLKTAQEPEENMSDDLKNHLARESDTILLFRRKPGVDTSEEAGEVVGRIKAGMRLLPGLAFSPDGSRLAATGILKGEFGQVRVWSLVPTKKPSPDEMLAAPPPQTVRAALSRPTVYGKPIVFPKSPREDWVREEVPEDAKLLTVMNAIAFSPDGQRVATGNNDGAVFLFDIATGRARRRMDFASQRPIAALAWQKDPRYGTNTIAVGVEDKIFVWAPDPDSFAPGRYQEKPSERDDLKKNEYPGDRSEWQTAGGRVVSLAMGADGKIAAGLGGNNANTGGPYKVVVWDRWDDRAHRPRPNAAPFAVGEHAATVAAVALTSDGRTVASGDARGEIAFWDATTRDDAPRAAGSFEGDQPREVARVATLNLPVHKVRWRGDSKAVAWTLTDAGDDLTFHGGFDFDNVAYLDDPAQIGDWGSTPNAKHLAGEPMLMPRVDAFGGYLSVSHSGVTESLPARQWGNGERLQFSAQTTVAPDAVPAWDNPTDSYRCKISQEVFEAIDLKSPLRVGAVPRGKNVFITRRPTHFVLLGTTRRVLVYLIFDNAEGPSEEQKAVLYRELYCYEQVPVDGALSPDGRRVAVTSFDGTVRIWSLYAPTTATVTGPNDPAKDAGGRETLRIPAQAGTRTATDAELAEREGEIARKAARKSGVAVDLKAVERAGAEAAGKAREKRGLLKPLLSIFPGRDGQWIAWNDATGYFTATDGAEGRVGWQVNRQTAATYALTGRGGKEATPETELRTALAEFYTIERMGDIKKKPEVLRAGCQAGDFALGAERLAEIKIKKKEPDAEKRKERREVGAALENLPRLIHVPTGELTPDPTTGNYLIPGRAATVTVRTQTSDRSALWPAGSIDYDYTTDRTDDRLRDAFVLTGPQSGDKENNDGPSIPPAQVMLNPDGSATLKLTGLPEGVTTVRVFARHRTTHIRSRPLVLRVQVPGSVPSAETKRAQPRIAVLSIGVGEFTGGFANLNFAEKDARNVAGAFQAMTRGKYAFFAPIGGVDGSRIVPVTVSDQGTSKGPVTVERMKAELKNFREQVAAARMMSHPDDLAVVFLATHGDALKSGNNEFYTAGSDTVKASPTTCLTLDDLAREVSYLKASNVLLILDQCFAGAVASSTARLEARAQARIQQGYNTAFARLHSKNFATLAAAGPGQQSWESPKWQDGAFTYALLKVLRGEVVSGESAVVRADAEGQVRLRVALPYLQEAVREAVREVVNGAEQTPVYYEPQGTDAARMVLYRSPAIYARAEAAKARSGR